MAQLPSGYYPLNMLYTNGSTTFDTGIVSSSVVDIEGAFSVSDSTTYLFGARNSNSNTSQGQFWASTANGTPTFGYRTSSTAMNTAYVGRKFNISKKGTEVCVNDGSYVGFLSLTDTAFTGTRNIYLLARNNAGTTQASATLGIFRFKIWENGVLVRDYVPCKRDTGNILVDVLYDLVNDTYKNVSSQDSHLLIAASSGHGTGRINSEQFGIVDSIYVYTNALSQETNQTPIQLIASAEKGYEFSHWTNSNGETISTEAEFWYKYSPTTRELQQTGETVTAHFTKVAGEEQYNGFRSVIYPYGKGWHNALGPVPEDPKENIYAKVLSANIVEDMLQKSSSKIIVDNDLGLTTDNVFMLYNSKGKFIFSGVVKSANGETLTVNEPLSIADSDFVINSGASVTNFTLNRYAYELLYRYLDGQTQLENPFLNTPIKKKCYPFSAYGETYAMVESSMNYNSNPPAIDSTEVVNMEDFIMKLSNEFLLCYRAVPSKKLVASPNVYIPCLQIRFFNPYSFSTLTIGNNIEEISEISIEDGTSKETYSGLQVFNSTGATYRAYYYIKEDGSIVQSPDYNLTGFVEPANVKIVLSDDALQTLKEQYLSSALFSHKIVFSVDLTKGNYNLDDFHLGRPVDFYMGNKLYKTMVTRREYTIEENTDVIRSVKVTCGKSRTSLTSKLNLRKAK